MVPALRMLGVQPSTFSAPPVFSVGLVLFLLLLHLPPFFCFFRPAEHLHSEPGSLVTQEMGCSRFRAQGGKKHMGPTQAGGVKVGDQEASARATE